MKIEIEKVYFILEQKLFELEDEKTRYGKYTPLLDVQVDIIHDLFKEMEETFKYTKDGVRTDDSTKKVSKRR